MSTFAYQFYHESAYVDTSASNDKENDPKVRKLKTRVCRHFESGRICPMGDRCGFAHGEHELTSKCETTGKRKTRICIFFAPGGDGCCPEGFSCDFLHPSDGPVFVKTVQYQIEKEKFNYAVQSLHAKRRFCTTQEEQDKLEDQINTMVRMWNKAWPKGTAYFDMHWMTTRGAEDYAAGIIIWMQRTNQKTAYLETGRGNHSTNGFAAIRTLLLTKYQGDQGVLARPDQSNPGIVILNIL
ncbi:hypothetical protein B9Z55_021890 [Caenorhabditis nigoni]|uniref:C3H1-type domain-containing protein n=1 Tax=Caenorhabditis nigoni TaxID=1611254 RepID=A0A2G5TU11_9PELO|nr:hypothetical protein B9Z55_021890 [Caenorhabditis nigoni]